MSSFSVVSAVICEDVRREASGQATIVGASPVGPTIGTEGEVIHSIAFYIEIVAKQILELDVRLVDRAGKNSVFERSFSLPIDVEENEMDWEAHTLMVLGFRDLKIPSAGEYLLQGRRPDGDWETIRVVLFPEDDEDCSESEQA
ncbi:hypothetical protein [Nioella sp.]|uniref:hypothetical protein n=1 Tax=Nioella sp. TaxID=1912091 RepID=UPI003A8971D7